LKLNGIPSREVVHEAYSKLQPLLKNGSFIHPPLEEYDAEKHRYIDIEALDKLLQEWEPGVHEPVRWLLADITMSLVLWLPDGVS
jgi:hypothetical protein